MNSKNKLLIFAGIIIFLYFFYQYSPFTSSSSSNSDGNVLIFYADWCGHCQNAKPEFEKAVKISNGKIIMINADDSDSQSIRKKYLVEGFPTILKVTGDSYVNYQGDRNSTDILSFLNNS